MKEPDLPCERLEPTATGPCVVELARALDRQSTGGKAAHLAAMLKLGLPVPEGFVVPRIVFDRFLDDNRLHEAVARVVATLDPDQPEGFETASRTIRDRVLRGRIPESVLKAVLEARETMLPGGELIVRSSAVGEDGRSASFAGQLDSIYPVNTAAEMIEALLSCWASYWSARVLFYQASGRGKLDGMAVIVQRLVPSAVSGVLFTRAPDGGTVEAERMLGEFCFGHGEGLVAGRVNPGRFTICRSALQADIASFPEEGRRPGLETLLPPNLETLGRHSLALERIFDAPQDIEWTITESGALFFLQSRAITTLGGSGDRQPPPFQAGVSVPNGVLWSNANINENFPNPISPLLYSVLARGYYHYFRNLALGFGISQQRIRAMEPHLRRIVGVHAARPYYNLSAIHAVIRLAPQGKRLVEFFNLFVGAADQEDTNESGGRIVTDRISLVETVKVVLQTCRQYFRLPWRVNAFEKRVDGFCSSWPAERLQGASRAELLEALNGFLRIRCREWNDAALADCAAMVTYGVLAAFLKRAVPGVRAAALHNSLLKGTTDLVSGQPPVRLWELSRCIRESPSLRELFDRHSDYEIVQRLREDAALAGFASRFDDFLRDWGFRFSGELMLTIPALDEHPAGLAALLRQYATLDGESPSTVLQRQADDRERQLAGLAVELERSSQWRGVPSVLQARLLRGLTHGCQSAIAFRERVRLKQARLYHRCRRIALAAGECLRKAGNLDRPEDVFFLTVEEVEELLAGTALFPDGVRRLIRMRKQEHQRQGGLTPPDSMKLAPGEFWKPTGESVSGAGSRLANNGRLLSGLSACGGRVQGRAMVLGGLSEASCLRRGDVLVTRQTDPGWSPVFFLIRGLVLERGGMLSHGAIIAREYGIPAVVGVAGATRLLSSGGHVEVNGDTGHVERIDENPC